MPSRQDERILPWIKRPDLLIDRYDAGSWVVKDPLTLTYTYLDDLECRILQLLDGRTTFSGLLNRARQVSLDASVTAEELAEFIRILAGHKLIRQTLPSPVSLNGGQRNGAAWRSVFGKVFQLLRMRVRLLNPTAPLNAAMPVVRRLAQPLTIAFVTCLVLIAAALVMLRFRELRESLPDLTTFLGPQNLLLMLIVFVSVKAAHEAGHALTARYFNAECSECGVMLLMFTPVLYTNVSDSWTLPRRQRMCVTAAGIAVEILIAAVCTIAWWFALPGTIKAILLNTMVICSVNTLLFNGNPLLRFDGYFLLSDYVRIPNLAQQSSAVVKSIFRRYVAGDTDASEESRSEHFRVLLSYGLMSLAYRALLTLMIVRLIYEVGQVWKLNSLALIVNCVIIAGFIGIPVMSVLVDGSNDQSKSSKSFVRWLRLSAFAGCVGLLLLVRLPHSVTGPAYVRPAGQQLYAQLPGAVAPLVAYGDRVQSQQVVAVLTNADLERRQESLSAEVQQLQQQLELLLDQASSTNSDQIPLIRSRLQSAQIRQSRFLAEYDQLRITADRDGILFPPLYRSHQLSSAHPEEWSGYPLDSGNRAAFLDRGVPVGTIGDTHEVSLMAWIDEKNIEFIRAGQQVEFLSRCSGVATVFGTVERIASDATDDVPPELGLAGMLSGHGVENGIRPATPMFAVTIQLNQDTDLSALPLYSVGQVRISTADSSLAHRWSRALRQTFSSSVTR